MVTSPLVILSIRFRNILCKECFHSLTRENIKLIVVVLFRISSSVSRKSTFRQNQIALTPSWMLLFQTLTILS